MRPSPAWLLVLAFAVYGGSLFGGFILDDFAIFADPVITSSSGWWEIWRPQQTRPLTQFTFWLDYHLWKQNPFGYHAANLGLHLIAVWLIFQALRRLLYDSTAWMAAAIFAGHPLQAETVNYIFARGTLLMSIFCLLSLKDWFEHRAWRAVLWFGLALLAKEEAVGFPFFLMLLHLSLRRDRSEWKPIAAMFGMAVLFGARVLVVTAVTPGSGAGAQAGIDWWSYFAMQGNALLIYLSSIFLPLRSVVMSSGQLPQWWFVWFLLPLIIYSFPRFREAGPRFWSLAGLVLLLPSSSILPAADVLAYRRMYLPMFAFSVLVVMIVRWRRWLVVAVFALVGIYQTYLWTSPERLWRAALRWSPDDLRAQIQLSRVVPNPESMQLLEAAKKYQPGSSLVASELGRAYMTSGSPDKALTEFGRALAMTPNNPQALSNRGVALLMLKQPDAARADFERALQIDPCAFEARLNATRMGLSLPPAEHCRFSAEERQALSGDR